MRETTALFLPNVAAAQPCEYGPWHTSSSPMRQQRQSKVVEASVDATLVFYASPNPTQILRYAHDTGTVDVLLVAETSFSIAGTALEPPSALLRAKCDRL